MTTDMNMNKRSRRRLGRLGFTLAEILIALALIAVLAAVLLPAVAGQIMKGDAGRTMQDLDAVRAGVDQFLADVHRYPMRVSHLTTKVLTTDRDVNGTLYPAGMVAKWSGPYITKTLNDANVLPTGFGGTIQDSLVRTLNSNGINYVTVRIFGLDSSAFARLDLDIDGPSASWTNARTLGLLRWTAGSGTDTTRYLATPIQ
jgi:prepilin-type N-terminal cleavage/methylation domain-containing protein